MGIDVVEESDDLDCITQWLDAITKDGRDDRNEAQHQIWQSYSSRIARHSRKRLEAGPQRIADEDDVTSKVLNSLFARLSDGRLVAPENRQQLWALLVAMADRKSNEQIRKEMAQKRGAGSVRGESVFSEGSRANTGLDQADLAFNEAIALTDLLESIDDDQLRQMVMLRLANHSQDEIASIMNCSKSSVQRGLQKIRGLLD